MSAEMSHRESIIEVRRLAKSFGSLQVLNQIDLDVPTGAVTTIIGKSGSGKSVMLKCIAGLLQPDSGDIRFQGESILHHRSRRLQESFRSRLSYMFQNNALFDSLSVEQNIALPIREKSRLPMKKICERIYELIERLDLDRSVLTRYPSQLSGGMQKRVALARALVTQPDVVLFDEPTTGLDPVRKNTVYDMISRYQKRFGFSALIVSHDIPDVLGISDSIAILDQGQFRFVGKPGDLKETRSPFPGQHDRLGLYNPFKRKILAYMNDESQTDQTHE